MLQVTVIESDDFNNSCALPRIKFNFPAPRASADTFCLFLLNHPLQEVLSLLPYFSELGGKVFFGCVLIYDGLSSAGVAKERQEI